MYSMTSSDECRTMARCPSSTHVTTVVWRTADHVTDDVVDREMRCGRRFLTNLGGRIVCGRHCSLCTNLGSVLELAAAHVTYSGAVYNIRDVAGRRHTKILKFPKTLRLTVFSSRVTSLWLARFRWWRALHDAIIYQYLIVVTAKTGSNPNFFAVTAGIPQRHRRNRKKER